jgi:hypothetical protein
MKHSLFIALCGLLFLPLTRAQHPWQRPVSGDRAEVERIKGARAQKKSSRDLHIVLVRGVVNHPALGVHCHPRLEKMDGKDWPLFWTRHMGLGGVFGSIRARR